MKLTKLLTAAATFATLALSAYAADTISLGQPGYGGTGCPGGSASVTLSPDKQSLSIIFDSFIVEAGGMTGKRLDRKNCNVAIPVHVPQGMSVSVLNVDYRGFNDLPSGAMSRFNVEYFFAGTRGPLFTKTFYGPLTQDYDLSNRLDIQALVWSPCGADVNLRVNASMMGQTNRYNEGTLSTVDSADFNAAMVYHLQWKSCR